MTHEKFCVFPPDNDDKWGFSVTSDGKQFFTICICDRLRYARADERAKYVHVCPDNNCCIGEPE